MVIHVPWKRKQVLDHLTFYGEWKITKQAHMLTYMLNTNLRSHFGLFAGMPSQGFNL